MGGDGEVGDDVIALFPLTDVLLPAMPLPLQIFEPRYQQMLADIADAGAGAGFGVVVLRTGSEAAPPDGDPDVAEVGTFAEILEVAPQEDGTTRLLTVGSRRFCVEEFVAGRPYVRARISWLGETEGEIGATSVEVVHLLCAQLTDAIGALSGQGTTFTPLRDPTMLSYQVAASMPLAPSDRQELLASATTGERLGLAIQLLRRELRLVSRTRSIAMSPAVLRLAAEPN